MVTERQHEIRSIWTEDQRDAVEDMRREILVMRQTYEAAKEEQEQELLRCQHEIQTLHELIVTMQKDIMTLASVAVMPSDLGSNPANRSETTNIETEPKRNPNLDSIPPREHEPPIAAFQSRPQLSTKKPISSLPERVALKIPAVQRSLGTQFNNVTIREIYAYSSLPDSHSIRLLTLKSGSTFAPLQCELTVSHIASRLPYQALSYAWGENTRTHHVLIEGKYLSISKNLDRALRKIRRTEQDISIWVDAVCINQDNAAEKAEQVSMMLQIYQSAQKVLVYLGEQSDHSELMPGFFDTTIRANRLFRKLQDGIQEVDGEDLNRSMTALEAMGDPTSDHIMWRAARAFYGRPWMLRVWVVQEIMAAKELVFLCGSWSVSGATIYNSTIASTFWPSLSPFGEGSYQGKTTQEEGFRHLFGTLLTRQTNPLGKRAFLDLFLKTSNCKATDPRDRVYAVIGMAQEAKHPSLRPNYSEDWRETYLRYAEHFIREGSGLRVLSLSCLDADSPNKHQGKIPSWVPDFSFEGDRNIVANGESSAGGHGSPVIRLDASRKILTISVIRLGNILSISSSASQQQSADQYVEVQQWRTELEELWPLARDSSSTTTTTKKMQDTICRVMLCHQQPSNIESSRRLVWSVDATQFEGNPDRIHILRDLVHRCRYLQRCVTSTGLLGQVPLHARQGDEIVIVVGAVVPFVLRPCHGGRYRLMGQTYFDGVMMGEAFQSDGFVQEEIELI